MRTVYVNGDYVPENEAKVSVFDRGFLFADGVYEVTSVLDGKLVDFAGHCGRLRRSLSELSMNFSVSDDELLAIHRELVSRNGLEEGLVYLQVTRGAADRDFVFPPDDTPATLVLFTQEKSLIDSALAQRGQKIFTVGDHRWSRCDIKTVQLLYPSLAKMEARAKGGDDAWLVRDGLVTEGSSNNAYIVLADGSIVTRDISNFILHGITRKAVLACARKLQMKVVERAFTVEEARHAVEAFSTSASGFVSPVISIDGHEIGDGKPGPVARKLRDVYIEEMRKASI
ncbi:D-amino-acid transaminase [Hoeflea prorocentri]|uniref:Probable branched-chain-amino-acid aminotransferase n=1 Tax=Hoeflea prorocentri TaxID=1922333 RepID=A0A9X3ZHX3_9HYPH|nr:D-amino-acid transaminase [Hoeflea prorocentri]MCY6381286.1 D-amino-acid transaminase [Hoeflea prorocentri]MDA5399086.1 D-amino-acid transaminase [Hoeflea prorocentri]